jgi:hypothetical protein
MARYKEVWESPADDTTTGYADTDTPGRFLPLASQEVADWIALGNTPDPAYTLAERQAAAITFCEAILEVKTAEPVLFLSDLIIADKKHKDDIVFRAYAGDKAKNIKVKKADKKLKTVDKNDIDDMLTIIGNRDDAAYDAYEIAVAAIEAATDWAGVAAAIAAFEAS